jgi:hypothetical protein
MYKEETGPSYWYSGVNRRSFSCCLNILPFGINRVGLLEPGNLLIDHTSERKRQVQDTSTTRSG